jgi:hypothetical protein
MVHEAYRDCDLCWSVAVEEASLVQPWQRGADGFSEVGRQRLTTCSAAAAAAAVNMADAGSDSTTVIAKATQRQAKDAAGSLQLLQHLFSPVRMYSRHDSASPASLIEG